MADETPEEKPKRPRRRRKPAEADAGEATPTAAEETAGDETAAAETAADEIEPTPEDEQAEEEAADVVLEAEAEIDEDSEPETPEPVGAPLDEEEPVAEEEAEEPEAEAAAPRRRRRRTAAEPKEPPAKPAPRRRRAQRDPSLPPPVVRAQAKYVRSSARKARLVCDHIRGKSVEEARAILAHAPRSVARDWSKLLESAVANAEHNHELVGEDLYVKAVQADEGPTIKRYRPRALGRATRIRKRTSHLTILLTPKD
jgi:large subunit ribosomal protein L22